VQVEIPIESEQQQQSSPHNSSAMESTSNTGYLAHQSMTSSQTITTIASINNRTADTEGGDVTSLIRPEIVGIHIALNSGNNCNGRASSRFSNDSSSRCTSSSDRHNGSIFNKESHDHHQHDTSDVSECKNVYNSTELNKVPMTTHSHLSTRSLTLPRNVHARANFLPLDRCEEMGIR
jgi:hypothetical protein